MTFSPGNKSLRPEQSKRPVVDYYFAVRAPAHRRILVLVLVETLE
jgi:hypothetical protein